MSASGHRLDHRHDARIASALNALEDTLRLLDEVGVPDLAARCAELIDRLRARAS